MTLEHILAVIARASTIPITRPAHREKLKKIE
jgi:hypothetical protein